MSSDLQWLLLRKNNAFMVKRVPEGPVFSAEPGNLRNLHSHKFSGLTNPKSVHIAHNGATVTISTRKPSASPHHVRTARHQSTVRPRSGPRRAAGVAASVHKTGYRPDLRTAAIARVSALLAAQREPKPTPERKQRGKKAQKTEA